MKIQDIFQAYDPSASRIIKEIDSSRGKKDIRKTYLVEFASGQALAIKVTRNEFTSPLRVAGWHELIERYNALGIYAPRIVRTLNNELSFRQGNYLIYAEEEKIYLAADEFTPRLEPKEYDKDIFEMIGKLAASPPLLFKWPTSFCLYEKFSSEDPSDDNFAYASDWCQIYSKVLPEKKNHVEEIWRRYLALRKELESDYQSLPRNSFQGDLNSSNLLFNQNKEFVGLLDFNLSGREVILNYALCESFPHILPDDLKYLNDEDFLKKHDKILKRRLGYIKEYYQFTPLEKEIFPKLYNMVVPFRWPAFFSFSYAVKSNLTEYFDSTLTWVYYQIMRKNLEL